MISDFPHYIWVFLPGRRLSDEPVLVFHFLVHPQDPPWTVLSSSSCLAWRALASQPHGTSHPLLFCLQQHHQQQVKRREYSWIKQQRFASSLWNRCKVSYEPVCILTALYMLDCRCIDIKLKTRACCRKSHVFNCAYSIRCNLNLNQWGQNLCEQCGYFLLKIWIIKT